MRRNRQVLLSGLVLVVLAAPCGIFAINPAQAGGWDVSRGAAPSDGSQLPRVLIIGDSISNGYAATVRKQLEGKAVVDHWATPLWVTHGGIHAGLEKAVGDYQYAVIHFNHGLHGWQKDRTPEGSYEPAMRRYMVAMKKCAKGATVIWGSTTPMTVKGSPEQLDPENNPTILRHNAIAAKVMKKNGIAVNDLYAQVVDHPEWSRKDRFHYDGNGSKQLGQTVAAAISKALDSRAAATTPVE